MTQSVLMCKCTSGCHPRKLIYPLLSSASGLLPDHSCSSPVLQSRPHQHPWGQRADSISIPLWMLVTLQKPGPHQALLLQCPWSHTDVFHSRALIEDFVGCTSKLSLAQRTRIVRNNYQTHSNFLCFDYSLFPPLFWDKKNSEAVEFRQ